MPHTALHSPRIGAVVVESLEVFSGDEFTAVHPGLDGAEPSEDADLLHIAHHRRDLQPLQLRVDRVQSADQVLQKQVESLRKADELAAVHGERSHFGTAQLDHLALIVLRYVFNRRRSRVHGFAGG